MSMGLDILSCSYGSGDALEETGDGCCCRSSVGETERLGSLKSGGALKVAGTKTCGFCIRWEIKRTVHRPDRISPRFVGNKERIGVMLPGLKLWT